MSCFKQIFDQSNITQQKVNQGNIKDTIGFEGIKCSATSESGKYIIRKYSFPNNNDLKKAQELVERIEHLSFPFLTPLKGKFEENGDLFMTSETFPLISIKQFINNRKKESKQPIQQKKFIEFIAHGALTIEFLHKNKIIHGQISSRNIFYEDDETMRIGPIDLDKRLHEPSPLPNDVFKTLKAEDMRDFGIVLYELAEQQDFQSTSNKPYILNHQTDQIKNLILTLLDQNPNQRPSARDILQIDQIKKIIDGYSGIIRLSQSNKSINEKIQIYRNYLSNLLIELTNESVSDRLSVAQRGEFELFADILKWGRKQPKYLIYPLYEWICECIDLIIDENTGAVKVGYESKIVKALQKLLGNVLNINEVKFIHANSLKSFSTFGSLDQLRVLYNMGISQSIIRNLQSRDPGVQEKISVTIVNILIVSDDMSERREKHPYLDAYEQGGIVKQVYEYAVLQGSSEKTRITSSFGIGWLYTGQELPIDMRKEVIRQLKIGSKSEEKIRSKNSSNALLGLSWNQANHEEILADNFLADAEEIMINNELQSQTNTINLVGALIENGSENIQEVVIQSLNLTKIRELTKHKDSDVKGNAFNLLSWITSRKQMISFKQLKKEISDKTSDELLDLVAEGLLSDIQTVIRLGSENVYDYGGLATFALDVTQKLMAQNSQLVSLVLDDGIIDELFRFFTVISPLQIYRDMVMILIYLADVTSDQQKIQLKKEQYITPLVHLLDSQDEDVLRFIGIYFLVIFSQQNDKGQLYEEDQYRILMEKNNGLDKLINIFNNNSLVEKDIKKYVSIVIGIIHKAVPLPEKYGKDVIEYLKTLYNDDDHDVVIESAHALARLAENIANHPNILSGNFSVTLRNYIINSNSKVVDGGMLLALNLLYFGTDDTKQKVQQAVPQDAVAGSINNSQIEIGMTAELLDQWLLSMT